MKNNFPILDYAYTFRTTVEFEIFVNELGSECDINNAEDLKGESVTLRSLTLSLCSYASGKFSINRSTSRCKMA